MTSRPRIRLHARVVLFGVALGLVASASSWAQTAPVVVPAPDARTLFVGPAFSYAGGESERAGLRAAIDRSVDSLVFLIRGIARSRITNNNPVYASIAIRSVSGQIDVAMPGVPVCRSPEDGRTIAWTNESGDSAQLSQRFEGGRLVQVISGGGGSRRNEFTLSPDGHTLTMRVRITSGQLPVPVQYSLTYRRP